MPECSARTRIGWLLACGDPCLRFFVLTELLGEPAGAPGPFRPGARS